MANEKDIEMEKVKLERLKVYGKVLTVLISVCIGTFGVAYINHIIQNKRLEGQLKQQEMRYLGEFLSTAIDENYETRFRFAEYFATLTSSPPLQAKWIEFRDKIEQTMTDYHVTKASLNKLQAKEHKSIIEKEEEERLETKLGVLQMKILRAPSTQIASIAEGPEAMASAVAEAKASAEDTKRLAVIEERLEAAEKAAAEAKARAAAKAKASAAAEAKARAAAAEAMEKEAAEAKSKAAEEARVRAAAAAVEAKTKAAAEAKARAAAVAAEAKVRAAEEAKEKIARRITGYEIKFKTKYLSKNATVTLQPNSGAYYIYNQPGGCGPNDIAMFSISNHILQTYIKDSCTEGSKGNLVNLKDAQLGTKSRATDYGYWIECTLINKYYSE